MAIVQKLNHVEERKRKIMTNENIRKGQEILKQDYDKLSDQKLTCISYMDTKTHEIHYMVFLGYYLLDLDDGMAYARFDISLDKMTIDLFDANAPYGDSHYIYAGEIMSIYHVDPSDLYALDDGENKVWDRQEEEDEGRKLYNEFIEKYNIDEEDLFNLIMKLEELGEKESE